MIRYLIHSIFLITIACSIQAQSIVHYNGQNFEEFKLNVRVTKLLVDRQGFLWAGLENGLARYDGFEFIYFKDNPLDSLGYKGQVVYDIFEDHEGGLWVGTDHGVNYKSPTSKSFVHFHINRSRIISIAEDKDSTMWFTSQRTLIKLKKGIRNDSACHLYQAREGVYFHRLLLTDNKILGTGNGLFELSIENDSLMVNKLLEKKAVHGILKGEDGSLVLGLDSGYAIVQYNRIIEKQLNPSSANYELRHKDKSGKLWFSNANGVVSLSLRSPYDPDEVNTYTIGRGVADIAEDKSGNLFFAMPDRILKLGWNNKQYKFFSLPEGFHNSYVFNFVEDGDHLWIGSFDGLFRYNQKQDNYTVYRGDPTNQNTMPHSSIYGLMRDSRGSLWAGTGKGVVKYDAVSRRFLRVPVDGLSHHLFESKDGLIWFVSDDKLYSFDQNKWVLNHIDSVEGNKVTANQIFIDSENILWASSSRGLQDYNFDAGQLKPRGNILTPVQSGRFLGRVINEDKIGQLWVSYQVGVIVINMQSRKVVRFMNTTNSPLQQDDAYGIVCDQAGNIWLKQHLYGSICIDPKTFQVAAYNPSWLFSGLYGERGRQPACVAAVGYSGKLYADGHGDFCVFYPDSLRINKVPPQVVLHEFKMNGEIKDTKHRFASNENNAEFIIGALHFDNPKLNRYAYFLEGFDAGWSQPTANNEIRYSSLPAGTFNFYLKAANSDGVWSAPKLMATFTILPVWWQTTLAYLVYGLIGVGLFFIFYRIRLTQRLAEAEAQKLKEMDDFKNQFFTNITHEFRTPLTIITGVAEKIEGQPGILIKGNAEQLLALINQILELSKVEANAAKLHPEPVNVVQYLKYLLQSFTSLADEKSIALQFENDTDQLHTVLDKTKFTLIIQNLVTNAVKFTNLNGIITIKIKAKENHFEIEVSDTGVGIDSTELPFIFNRFYQASNQPENFKGTGIGLALTKELVGLMHGSIEVKSKKGSGSTFIISLPLQRQVIKEEIQLQENKGDDVIDGDERLSILLIEDNEDVAAVVRDILSEKFEVSLAANGREGVEKAIDKIPDVIISDVMMPGMNGLEVTQLLKSDTRTSHIPLILLTAKADIDSRLSGLSHGADIYLAKPFHSKELLLHIQNLIRLRDSLRLRYAGEQTISKESNHPEDKFVLKLQNLVFEHLSDDTFGIDEICKGIGVSRTQLHRKLKAITGKSASIYIRDLRLAEGKKLLLQNSSTVAEVAYFVGFSDPNYFSRLYSEKYGHPPTQEHKN